MMANALAGVPAHLLDELITTLAATPGARIERIVSTGHASPPDFWYDQDWDEFVLLLAGAARLEFAEGLQPLAVGDWLVIPAHRRHRVAWTDPDQPTVWLAVHMAPDAPPPPPPENGR